MAQDGEGAGADDDVGQDGNGAPSGGSPKGGSENEDGLDEKFEKRIKAALANQRAHYETQLGSVRAEFQAFKEGVGKQQPPADQPKVYSRPELKAAVEGGRITQEQADDIWDRQREAQLTERAENAALDVVERKTKKERIDSDLAAYKRLAPEILEEGDKRSRIREEFNYLVGIGDPKTVDTELKAIRAVMGPLEKLERARSARRSEEHDPQGGSSGDGPKAKAKGFEGTLSARERTYYQKGIDSGRYKDWKDVEAEFKFANPKVRERAGIRS